MAGCGVERCVAGGAGRVAGYRCAAKGGVGNRVKVRSLSGQYLAVRFLWSNRQSDLDGGAEFLGRVVGSRCLRRAAFFSEFKDDTSNGGAEEVSVYLNRALVRRKWTKRVEIKFRADWFGVGSKDNQGLAVLQTVLKHSGNDSDVEGTALAVVVRPGVSRRNCVATTVARLVVKVYNEVTLRLIATR